MALEPPIASVPKTAWWVSAGVPEEDHRRKQRTPRWGRELKLHWWEENLKWAPALAGDREGAETQAEACGHFRSDNPTRQGDELRLRRRTTVMPRSDSLHSCPEAP